MKYVYKVYRYQVWPSDNLVYCICSLELLSLTAGLFPALLLYGNHTQLAKAVLSVLQQKLSSLSVSELATAPAQVLYLHDLVMYMCVYCEWMMIFICMYMYIVYVHVAVFPTPGWRGGQSLCYWKTH